MQEGTIMSEGYTDVPACPMSGDKTPAACPAGIREVLSMVGDKWSMLVVGMLRDSPMRFNELRRRIDAAQRRICPDRAWKNAARPNQNPDRLDAAKLPRHDQGAATLR
jgi:hypothetical protein